MPDDLLNIRYDPLACAVAAGWDGALVEETVLVGHQDDDGSLAFPEELGGRKTSVVTGVDGPLLRGGVAAGCGIRRAGRSNRVARTSAWPAW